MKRRGQLASNKKDVETRILNLLSLLQNEVTSLGEDNLLNDLLKEVEV